MHRHRDLIRFAIGVVCCSVLFAAALWALPRSVVDLRVCLIAIPTVSVVLNARAYSWVTRLGISVGLLGVFALYHVAFNYRLGFYLDEVAGREAASSALFSSYYVVGMALPVAVLIALAGRDPSRLWRTPALDGQKSAE